MIKLIQQIYRIYSNPHKGLYKCSFFIYYYLFFSYCSFDAHGATSYYYFRNVLLCLHMIMSELAINRKHFVPLL